MSERKSGLLLHISSLPGAFGIGDLGPNAYHFVDFLHRTKQSYWQILPVNPTEPMGGNSPYSSYSAFAGNTLFISPQLLADEGLLDQSDIDATPDFSEGTVPFEKVVPHKKALLDKAFERFTSSSSVRQAHEKKFNKFVLDNAFWIEDFALFVSVKNRFKGKIWTEWSKDLRDRNKAALSDFSAKHKEELSKIKFLQYLFFSQWSRLKEYCTNRGVRLFGDLAIYMSLDSADVWQYPGNYKLDENFSPVAVAGVPPDYFSETGQRWGNPVYDWDVLKKSKFAWWVERFRFNFHLFDVVRIDHFRGLVQYWEIPAEEKTAINGRWADVPTDDLFNKLEESFTAPLSIIAEDLGYITEDVREVMHRFGFPGMKILLFAFNGDLKSHPYLPHNFKKQCVVYTGTHDNNTVKGWFTEEASQEEISNLELYTKMEISPRSVHWDLIRMAFTSDAELAIIPVQDVLGLGSEARMNKPGTVGGKNWCWRLCASALTDALAEELLNLTVTAKRD